MRRTPERFTRAADRVPGLTEEVVCRPGHQWVGSEHVLLGLMLGGEGVPARVLFATGWPWGTGRRGEPTRGEPAEEADLLAPRCGDGPR